MTREEYQAKWHQDNRERRLQAMKANHAAHREERNQAARGRFDLLKWHRYAEANADRIRKARRDRYARNKAKRRAENAARLLKMAERAARYGYEGQLRPKGF